MTGKNSNKGHMNGWRKSTSRGEYKRIYQTNENDAYANETSNERVQGRSGSSESTWKPDGSVTSEKN